MLALRSISFVLATAVVIVSVSLTEVTAFVPSLTTTATTTTSHGVVSKTFPPPHTTSKTPLSTTSSSLRLDSPRLYSLFSNNKHHSSSSSSSSLSSSFLPNSNGDDPEPSLYNANNTSIAVYTPPVSKNGKSVPTDQIGKNGHARPPVVVPPSFKEGSKSPSGIGGQGGVTYNVNALKRNLLQETVRAYKMELLALLQSPSASEDVICQKLAALVQASPVRTTTDSNLLQADGVRWTLCYQSRFTTVSHLRQPPAPLMRKNQKNSNNGSAVPPTQSSNTAVSPAMRRLSGKELSLTRSRQRSFHLESLPDNQVPHVVDHESNWGGLVRSERTYSIKALTRTSLSLQLQSSQRWVLGRLQKQQSSMMESSSSRKKTVTGNLPIEMTIIYSDTDLCIVADPQQKTYQVYTQADAWESTQLARQLRFLLASFWYRLTHLGGDGGGTAKSRSRRDRSNARLIRELQLNQDLLDEESRLIVWQLGAGDDDEEAWESRKDPFVHLSADDRQRILKAMSVRQVRQAAQEYASHQKRARFLNFSWWPRRRTHFRKPELERRQRRQPNFKKPQ